MNWPSIQKSNTIHRYRHSAVTKNSIIESQRDRILTLEMKCRWAADQFEEIETAIADNAASRAQIHASMCVPEMDPDVEGESTTTYWTDDNEELLHKTICGVGSPKYAVKPQDKTDHLETGTLVTQVFYHSTAIVSFNAAAITLRFPEWRGSKEIGSNLMNQTANKYGLGYHMHKKNGSWYVTLPDGETTVHYSDGMTFGRNSNWVRPSGDTI